MILCVRVQVVVHGPVAELHCLVDTSVGHNVEDIAQPEGGTGSGAQTQRVAACHDDRVSLQVADKNPLSVLS